jgi:predicted transcriptional regulator
MIKFFRKIRQKLLSENKFSKYLLYAVGEIVLVVIGILLALQINNWNQQRIENKQEIEILISINDEFRYNLRELDQSIKINKKVAQSCLELTKLIRLDSISKVPEIVDSLLVNIGDFNSFDARIGVTEEIVNSGKLSILENDEIRNHLGNWLKILADDEEDVLFRSDNYTMNLMPFLMKRFPLSNGELTKKLEFDKNNYLVTYKEKSPFKMNLSTEDLMQFENQVWHHKHNHDYVVINELNIRDFVTTTIKMIEEELNKKK